MTETVDNIAKDETEGVDGAPLQIKGPIRDVSSIVYTAQQIEDYCKRVEARTDESYPKGQGDYKGVQIIRQLQANG